MHGNSTELYERDFYAWTRQQAKELRRWATIRPDLDLDLPHLAEEIRDLGKEQRNALRSWTVRIIEHLLLLAHSPATEPRRHWAREIAGFRVEIEARITPTLRQDLARQRPFLYDRARRSLVSELDRFGESEIAGRLPEHCPYSLEQILGDWWPD